MEDVKLYRYPGVRPFSTEDKDIFFGRDDDITRLFKLIMLEKTTVLFGKSGHGKSSLINAGLIPKLKDKDTNERFRYYPIQIRIGKIAGQNESPVQKVISKLNDQFPDLDEWTFLKQYEGTPLLWYNFKKKQSRISKKIILIFDQFEEFFTYPDEEQQAFRWELAELLFTEIPQNIRENIDKIDNEQFSMLSFRSDIKLLFSIRSDRFSLLHSMQDALPCILRNIFEIKGLKTSQAKDAIILPAQKEEQQFVTHPFSYDDESLNIILKELSAVQVDGSEIIEAFHLQIICQGCENKIEEKLKLGIVDEEINKEDLPEFGNLYEEYYKRQIEKLPVSMRDNAQTVLEEDLIFENNETGECRRLSVDGVILQKRLRSLHIHEDLLNMLENTFLIRREPNTVGGFSYELSHDTIVDPVIRIKKEREKKRQLLIEKEEIKKQTLEEYRIKRRKQVFIFLGVLTVLLLIAWNWKEIYFGYYTFTSNELKPTVRLKDKLNDVIKDLDQQLLIDSRKIDVNPKLGAWEASQMMMSLKGLANDAIRKKFFSLTSNTIADSSCCCWVESKNLEDLRATGWVVSAIGDLGLTSKYKCDILDFFLNSQLQDGSWSMYQISKKDSLYGSTYATCHVLRALHNSLPYVTDNSYRTQIKQAVDKGMNWLLTSIHDPDKSVWTDYPKNSDFEDFLSLSLSGLVIHTLNLLGSDAGVQLSKFNKGWLQSLKISQAYTQIDHREQSDMLYKLNSSVADYTDRTRHLIVPWQIIATVDAFKDGSFLERYHANKWLDVVVENLDINEIEKNPRFIKAEVLISLRYLQGESYTFH